MSYSANRSVELIKAPHLRGLLLAASPRQLGLGVRVWPLSAPGMDSVGAFLPRQAEEGRSWRSRKTSFRAEPCVLRRYV